MKKLEELKKELDTICESTKTSRKGIQCLIDYYIKSLGWSESEAIKYTIKLFENGTIEMIKVIGKDGKEI